MANITTQTIRVDLSTGKVIPTAYTHQNDTARTLVFDMYNGGLPYTMTGNTVKFAYKSPIVNGQYSVIAGASMASGTVSGNKVTVTLPVAYTQISGVGMLTMIITPTSGTVRPVNIRLVVQKSADGDDTVAGASDFPTTLQQIADEWYDENIANWLNENIESVYDAEAFGTAIDSWLDDHPEATTTVQDGSITWGKLNATVQNKVAVTDSEPLYFAALKLAHKTGGRGDCNVFYGATNGIVDFGKDADVTDLLAFLQAKNIEKIDWAIISHYHADHCTENFTTALSKLISGGIDFTGCTFYLPHKNINWASFSGNDVMSARETDVKSALASASIEYIEPTNDAVVEFNGVRITFLNIGDYTDYYAYTKNSKGEVTSDTTYNNFSMVAVLEYLNKAIVMTGDIYDLAQDKIIDAIKKCDIYKVEHHASNSMYSHDWYAKIACEYAVVDQYSSDGWHIEELLMSGVRRLYEQGTKVLFTGNQTQILKIDYTGITMDDCLPSILPNTKQLASDFIIDYGADLNDYWHVGTYGSLNQTADYGYTLSNCPTTKIFKMEVTNIRGADWGDTLSRRQRIITVDGEEFVRRLNVNRNTFAVTTYAWMPLHATVQTGVAVLANNGAVEDTSTLRITRAGHVVTVRVDAKLLSTAGTGWHTVYSGLPGAANIVIFNAVTPNGNVFRANISADGNLQIANTAETDDRVDTTFMYITKNDV